MHQERYLFKIDEEFMEVAFHDLGYELTQYEIMNDYLGGEIDATWFYVSLALPYYVTSTKHKIVSVLDNGWEIAEVYVKDLVNSKVDLTKLLDCNDEDKTLPLSREADMIPIVEKIINELVEYVYDKVVSVGINSKGEKPYTIRILYGILKGASFMDVRYLYDTPPWEE